MKETALKMLPIHQYAGVDREDPIRFYQYPIVGRVYRRRIELCLAELRGGDRILEIGFGSGVTFLNLNGSYREIHGLDLKTDIARVSELFGNFGVRVCLKNGSVLSMPYPDNYFDSILLISILEHLKPEELQAAFREIRRVLKNGGQVVYGVPAENFFMRTVFRLLGYSIRKYHLSGEKQVSDAARVMFKKIIIMEMRNWLLGKVYEIGHFVKEG